VVAFPLGYARSRAKADEAADLVSMGCREVDVVINIAALLEQDEEFVLRDIAAVVEAVAKVDDAALVKVILETGYLAADDIRRGCVLAVAAGARFVKTSTGFGPRGASVEDVRIMRQAVGLDFGVKAAGGIRSLDDALALLAAGADRIGTSVGDVLVDAAAQRGL
jgi:deoxyribose-phosphate aldolase